MTEWSGGARAGWARMALIYLSVTFGGVGLWATLAPRSFYLDFPGAGHRWLAGDGPYSAHLVSDIGVGFLAVGAVLVLAAVWMERRIVQAALVAVIVHECPHLVFHLRHPNGTLGSLDQSLVDGGIGFGLLVAAVLLAAITASSSSRPATRAGARAGRTGRTGRTGRA